MKPYLLISLLFVAIVWVVSLPSCTPVSFQEPVPSSHGLRIWTGATLKSFTHTNSSVCVPEGWEPVGSIRSGTGWAKYEKEMTGVMIRSDAFASTTISVPHSSYRVTLIHPKNTPPDELAVYTENVAYAFDRIGALYGDDATLPTRTHTVLVTAGMSFTDEEATSIYPDPGPRVSYYILRPTQFRSEELFFHAIMHLYNRHQKEKALAYENHQAPVPKEDWRELEATWAETAMRTTNVGRNIRLEYLYGIHAAVTTGDYSRITVPPFNRPGELPHLQQTVVSNLTFTYLDYQYGHYVLAPLVMNAIEGLLQHYETGTDIEALLTKVHTSRVNFFEELSVVLPATEMERIHRWLKGEEPVARDLVFLGASYYDR